MKFTKADIEKFEGIIAEASKAADKAGAKAIPTPMVVGSAVGFTNEMIPGTEEVVNEGVCGFAWVTISGRGKFARWTMNEGYSRTSFYKGFNIWSSKLYNYNGQSYERKIKAMAAASEVFNKHGISAYADGRLD